MRPSEEAELIIIHTCHPKRFAAIALNTVIGWGYGEKLTWSAGGTCKIDQYGIESTNRAYKVRRNF